MKKIKNKHLRKLHIYSSLCCCTLLLAFSLTGITLNHRTVFEGAPKYTVNEYKLNTVSSANIDTLLSRQQISLSDDEINSLLLMHELSIPTPGKRLELYLKNSTLFVEVSDFGFISRLNELHQGRHTSYVWTVISDITAIVLILISVTGIWLSFRDNKHRRQYLYFISFSLVSFVLFME